MSTHIERCGYFSVQDSYSCQFTISDQRALADACHGFHLLVALAAVQKFHGMLFVGQWVLCVCSVGRNHAAQK